MKEDYNTTYEREEMQGNSPRKKENSSLSGNSGDTKHERVKDTIGKKVSVQTDNHEDTNNWSLSSKIEVAVYDGVNYKRYYPEDEIKEFVRLEKELIADYMSEKITANEFWIEREKILGDKLTK